MNEVFRDPQLGDLHAIAHQSLSVNPPFTSGLLPYRGQKHKPAFTTDLVPAMFREVSAIPTVLRWLAQDDIQPVPGYNAFRHDDLTGYEDSSEAFVESGSPEETRRIKTQIDEERARRETIASAGLFKGLAAGVVAGMADPTNLLAGAIFYRGARSLQAAALVGRMSKKGKVIGTAAAEASALSATNELAKLSLEHTRTLEESAINIAADTVFAGLIGVGAATLSGPRLDALRRAAREDLFGDEELAPQLVEATGKDIEQLMEQPWGETRNDLREAARTIAPEYTHLFDPDSTLSKVLRGAMQLNPQQRTSTSMLNTTRVESARLMSKPFVTALQRAGQAFGTSVESGVERWKLKATMTLAETNTMFSSYKKKGGTYFRNTQAFRNAVARAMRRGDEAPIDIAEDEARHLVNNAADHFRKKYFDPIWARMIETGLAEDVGLQGTAASYFMRVYDTDLLATADGGDRFKAILRGYFMGVEGKSEQVARDQADEALANILKTPHATMTFELINTASEGAPFRERVLLIPDEQIEEFLKDDMETVIYRFWKATIPEIEMNAMSGLSMTPRMARMPDRAEEAINASDRGDTARLEDLWLETDDLHAAAVLERRGRVSAARELDDLSDRRAPLRGEVAAAQRQVEAAEGPLRDLEQARKNLSRRRRDAGKVWARLPKTVRDILIRERRAELERTQRTQIPEFRQLETARKQRTRLKQRIKRLESKQQDAGEARSRLAETEREVSRLQEEVRVARQRFQQEIKSPGATLATVVEAASRGRVARGFAETTEALQRQLRRVRPLRDLLERLRASEKTVSELASQEPQLQARRAEGNRKLGEARDRLGQVEQRVEELRREAQTFDPTVPLRSRLPSTRTRRELEAAQTTLRSRVSRVRHREARAGATLKSVFDAIDEEVRTRKAALEERVSQGDQAAIRESEALDRAATRDKRDLATVRDRLTGRAGIPDQPERFIYKAAAVMRTWNYLRLLGGVTVSSLADMGNLVLVNGFSPVARGFAFVLRDPLTAVSRIMDADDLARHLAAGEITEGAISTRIQQYTEMYDNAAVGSRLNQANALLTGIFSRLNGIAYWNGYMKAFSSLLAQDRIIATGRKLARGERVTKTQRQALAIAGLSEQQAVRIYEKHLEFGETTSGLRLSRAERWDDQLLAEELQRAVISDVNRTIVTPGAGDRPTLMDKESVRMILQFKTFAISATDRVLISSLQRRDQAVVLGLAAGMGWGFVVSWLKAAVAGRLDEFPWDDPRKLALEVVDRSGMLGVVMEGNNMLHSSPLRRLSISSLLGVDEQVSRYSARNVWPAILGPSAGLFEDGLQLTRTSMEEGGWTQADMRKLRRLLPLQNLTYLRWALDKAFGNNFKRTPGAWTENMPATRAEAERRSQVRQQVQDLMP